MCGSAQYDDVDEDGGENDDNVKSGGNHFWDIRFDCGKRSCLS